MNFFFIVLTILLLIGCLSIPNGNAETIPEWVKNTAGWWSTDAISETEFVNAIEFLINNEIIHVEKASISESSQNVPEWVKNTAGWWSTDAISETEFVSGIEFLIANGIINVAQKCIFENNEYSHLEQWQIFFLCSQIDFEYIYEDFPEKTQTEITYNTEGFRGPELKKAKLDGAYRIFTVGGSTTLGEGVTDIETYPYLLQKKFDYIKEVNIEVINAGMSGVNSKSEVELIKQHLVSYEPDLFLVYDGYNELLLGSDYTTPDVWFDRWEEICDLGKDAGFDVIIIVHPFLGTGDLLVRTDKETELARTDNNLKRAIFDINGFISKLPELDKKCSRAIDLTDLFSSVYEAVYFDRAHVTPRGNQVIANALFDLAIPIVLEDTNKSHNYSSTDFPDLVNSKAKTSDYMQSKFKGKLLENSNFNHFNLENENFFLTKIINGDLRASNLTNMKALFTQFISSDFSNAQLQNSKFNSSLIINSDLTNTSFKNSDLSFSQIRDSDLTNTSFKNSDLSFTEIRDSNLSGADFEGADLTHSKIIKINLRNTDLTNSSFVGAKILQSDLSEMDLSTVEIHGDDYSDTWFVGSNLLYVNFSKINMNGVDFAGKITRQGNQTPIFYLGSNLSHSVFSGLDLSNTAFSHNKICEDCTNLDREHGVILDYSKFDNVNLRGNDMSFISMVNSQIRDSDLTNTSFKNSDLSFTEIRDSNLSGADFEGADLEGVLLDNTILTNANLKCINHPICKSN